MDLFSNSKIWSNKFDHEFKNANIFSHSSLSNNPGKTGSSFLFYGAILFPHVGMFSLSHIECLNLQKGRLGNNMFLNSIFKGCLFVFKDLDQS